MAEKNWVVPVTLEGDYWSARLYFSGFETALQVKAAAQASIAGLATYVRTSRAFILGAPEEVA